MGYYTYYTLFLHGKEEDCEAFSNELLENSKDSDGNVDPELEELVKYDCVQAKLYDIEEWIGKVAPHHPNVLVCLSGDGEDSDDMWEERWKGNDVECQRAIIPPFTNPNLIIKPAEQNNNNN